MDGQMDGLMEQMDGWMDGWKDEWMDGMDGWMDRWMGRWMDRWIMDRWIDTEQMDEQNTYKIILAPSLAPVISNFNGLKNKMADIGRECRHFPSFKRRVEAR